MTRALKIAAFLAAFTAGLWPDQSHSAQCGRSEPIIAYLGKKYKEEPRAMGTVGSTGFMQLYVSEAGTWTVLLTSPEGISCIVAAGQNYEALKASEPPKGPPT